MTIEILEKRRKNNLVGVKISENPKHPLIYEKMLEDKRRYNLFGFKTVTNPCSSYLFADYIERVIDLMFSARMGNLEAIIELCKLYSDGHYVPSDGYILIRWFRIVANFIEPNYYDEYNLGKITFCEICSDEYSSKLCGKLYLYGVGIENNKDAAFELFMESIQCLNYSQKMYKLGKKYIYGRKKDFDKGIYWLNRAADHLNDDAILELGKIYLYGIVSEVDIEKRLGGLKKLLTSIN